MFETTLHELTCECLEETSMQNLEQKAIGAFPKTKKRQHATDEIYIMQQKWIALPKNKKLRIEATIRGSSGGKSKEYTTVVQFDDVQYEKVNTPDNISFVASNGEEYFVKPVSARNTNVHVKCDCLDFYWRFALWNFNDDSLYGRKPKAYVKKTNRAPANPQKMPGVCKHIMKFAKALRASTIVRS